MDISNSLLISKDEFKRARKSNAVKLPEAINESNIPKYVVYYKECYNREKKYYREFFKIEKHPKITNKKVYTSSKSNKINILEKLEQIKKILHNIENNEVPLNVIEENENENEKINENEIENEIKNVILLPKYINFKKDNNDKSYLIYDKKIGASRETFRALCDKNKTLRENLNIFIEKIKEKFN